MGVSKGRSHHTHSHKDEDVKEKSRVPIVDVFDDNDSETESKPLHPARSPVVVEIEHVLDEPEKPSRAHHTSTLEVEVDTEETLEAPKPPQEPTVEFTKADFSSSISNLQAPEEPSLPSFFEHDLKGTVPADTVEPSAPQSQEVKMLENTVPQAFVGEINEIGDDVKSEKKKLFGILLIVVAVMLLSLGLLVLYAKNIQQSSPGPTPASVITTPVPTTKAAMSPSPVATGSGSLTASGSGTLADLKKKVKVDILNGTTVAGLASKQATVVKKAGYLTGTVGNGKPENAGTIAVSTANMALAQDIQKLLTEFTFTITKNEKLTTVQVTLGQPKE